MWKEEDWEQRLVSHPCSGIEVVRKRRAKRKDQAGAVSMEGYSDVELQ